MSFSAGRLHVGALLTSILGLCLIPGVTRGEQPTAEQVLAAYAKAIGGEAATKVRTITADFRFSGGGLPQAMEGQGYIEPPDRNYLVIHLSSMGVPDFESGVNGDTAWRVNPGTGHQLLEGVEKRMALRGTRLNSFEGWQRVWKSVQLAGEESVGGTSCYKLVLTPPEGEPLTAHFDKRTGLLVQESINLPSTAPPLIVTTYSDYRDVGGGVLVAHRVEQSGPQPSVIEYTRIQLDAAVPPGRFELPEPVKNLLASEAEAAAQGPSEPRRSVQLGEIREVASKITNREYELIVNLPYSYARDRSKRYPVVYFTDGFYDFPLFAMIYGEQIYDRTLSECFMVGFSYKGKNADYERLRIQDYTPTKSAQYGVGGGAPEFLEVVEKELIPFMEANYRVDPTWRALAGSSAGGLFALYAMFAKPQLFNAVVAVSPGVLWADNWLFSYEEEFHARAKALPVSLYVTGAEKELPDQPAFLESIKRFDQVLKARRYEGLRYEFRLIDGARHSGSKPEGFSRGLQFIFEPRLAAEHPRE